MRLTALVASVLLSVLVAASPVQAATAPVDCVWNGFSYDCTTEIVQNGADGTAVADTGTGTLTAGPTRCVLGAQTVPCISSSGSFVNSAQCTGYVQLAGDQDPPPPGQAEGSGAWYSCTLVCEVLDTPDLLCDEFGIGGVAYWSTTPPAGVQQYTPAQAAAALARTFRLEPVQIGMAPARKVHEDDPQGTAPYRRTWVGVPVWLWVADPSPLTYGPYEQTATLGGVTVTARAEVTQVDWSSGDGQQVTCATGTVFDPEAWAGRAAEPSPTCGLEFQRTSLAQPGGAWTVTAASRWTVAWTGGGEAGTIDLADLEATTPVEVRELQSVNVPVAAAKVGAR